MTTNLLRIKTYGMKNIEKEISIDFYKDTIGKSINIKKYNAKAIYGSNGAGKTAIIQSINLYKNIVSNPLYLYQNSTIYNLNNFINKKTKKFYINVIISNENNKTNVFSHELTISIRNKIPHIDKETISILKGATLNSEYEKIIEIIEDKVVLLNNKFALEALGNIQILNNRSIINYLIPNNVKQMVINNNLPIEIIALTTIIDFSRKLNIKVNNQDNALPLNDFMETIKILYDEEYKNNARYMINNNFGVEEDLIEKSKFPKYEKDIQELFYFLSIFKSDLLSIKIDKRVEKNFYHCKKIFVYKDYEIDPQFESSGIKNLIEIFSYLKNCARGNIVFIDELDANINGVLLNKLVEYFIEYGKGQLCFTTHNTSPMKILKTRNESINFINNNLEIINWIKNGHYSPENIYQEGYIEGIPFNTESFDFLKAFNFED